MCTIFNPTCNKVSNIRKIIGCISRIDFVTASLLSSMELNMLVFYFVSEIDEDFSTSIISEASTEMLCVCKNNGNIWNLLPSLPSQVLNSLLPVSLYCICCQQVVPLYWISTPYVALTLSAGEFGGLINVLGLYFAPWTVPEPLMKGYTTYRVSVVPKRHPNSWQDPRFPSKTLNYFSGSPDLNSLIPHFTAFLK